MDAKFLFSLSIEIENLHINVNIYIFINYLKKKEKIPWAFQWGGDFFYYLLLESRL